MVISLAAAAACTGRGTAVGTLQEPSGPPRNVVLVWHSDTTAAPDHGQISGELPDGTRYAGEYFQVSSGVKVYDSAWVGWPPYWQDWGTPWYRGGSLDSTGPRFVEVYSGRVIANLQSQDQQHRMRCRFELKDPRMGLVGGGIGECQSSKGETIRDVQLKAK